MGLERFSLQIVGKTCVDDMSLMQSNDVSLKNSNFKTKGANTDN